MYDKAENTLLKYHIISYLLANQQMGHEKIAQNKSFGISYLALNTLFDLLDIKTSKRV